MNMFQMNMPCLKLGCPRKNLGQESQSRAWISGDNPLICELTSSVGGPLPEPDELSMRCPSGCSLVLVFILVSSTNSVPPGLRIPVTTTILHCSSLLGDKSSYLITYIPWPL